MSDDKHTLTFTNTTRASVPTQSHPVEFYGLPTRCEPPNLAVKGCTVHNTVTLDLALVRALVEALEEIERCGFYGASDIARAALAAAKEAGV